MKNCIALLAVALSLSATASAAPLAAKISLPSGSQIPTHFPVNLPTMPTGAGLPIIPVRLPGVTNGLPQELPVALPGQDSTLPTKRSGLILPGPKGPLPIVPTVTLNLGDAKGEQTITPKPSDLGRIFDGSERDEQINSRVRREGSHYTLPENDLLQEIGVGSF